MFKPISGEIKRGRRRGSGHPAPLTVITRKGGKAPNGESWYHDRVFFRIQEELWLKAGFTRGDKVQVLWDNDKQVGLIEKCDTGYSLTVASGSYDLMFLVPYDQSTGFPRFDHQTGLEPDAGEHGILFKVPPSNGMKTLATPRAKRVEAK